MRPISPTQIVPGRADGLAAAEDPELGFIGVLALKDVVQVCEEQQVASARAAGRAWTQIAAALEVSTQAAHHGTPPRSPPRRVEANCPTAGVLWLSSSD